MTKTNQDFLYKYLVCILNTYLTAVTKQLFGYKFKVIKEALNKKALNITAKDFPLNG